MNQRHNNRRPRTRQSNPFPLGPVLIFTGVLATVIIIGIIATVMHSNNVKEQNKIVAAKNAEILRKKQAKEKLESEGEPNAVTRTRQWQSLKTFSGIDFEETDPFMVKSKEWKIIWKTKEYAGQNAPKFTITLNNGNSEVIGQVISTNKPDQGEYIHKGKPGKFYLLIDSSSLKWEVEVKDYR